MTPAAGTILEGREAPPVDAEPLSERSDRGAHRFALDHPTLLRRLVLLDIAPTYDVFVSMDRHGARARWHWLFHLVPDLPEALIAGREEIYLRHFTRPVDHPAAEHGA